MIDIGRLSDRIPAQGRWLAAIFACVLLLQFELVINRPINWDEFYHLSEAHAFAQGRLTEALQMFYARAFFWLPGVPAEAVDQVRLARVFMFCCELVTTMAIYAMARRFAGGLPAALVALGYVAGGYVFQHGFSYRADPMAAAFLMGALWIMLASRLGPAGIAAAAFLAALATLTTIKVVLYAPAFAGIAWLRWHETGDRKGMALKLGAFAGLTVLLAAIFVGATLLSLPDAGSGSAEKTISASGTMMFDRGLFPRWPYVLLAMALAPLTALLVLIAPVEVMRAPLSGTRQVALVAMMLPLASIVLYANSFPYFYAYILPPVMVGAVIAAKVLIARVGAVLLGMALFANAAIISFNTPREVLPVQKEVLAAVHQIFPKPVAYFDFPGMVVDFPKANLFMTDWGIRKYWDGIEPSFVDDLSRQVVPLLLINQDILERNQTGGEPAPELRPEDARALREGFIPHWGPIWVAGRQFGAHTREQVFRVYTPGIYTLEGGDARIDRQLISMGETVTLPRGFHRFERIGGGERRLRWGDHLERPPRPFSGGPIFEDF